MYRWRALVAGALTAVLALGGLLLAAAEAPLLWAGMLGRALPLIAITMMAGVGAAAMLLLKKDRLARVLVVLETVGLLGSWGLAQLPHLIPPDVTVEKAAGHPAMTAAVLIGISLGMAVLLPSLWLLFRVFKSRGSAHAD